jgi:hypothetical protein
MTIGRTAAGLLVATASLACAARADDGAFPVSSNLKAAAAKADVTPRGVTQAAGHVRPVSGARDPIQVGVLLLDDGATKVAIVTSDFLEAWDDFVTQARTAIEQTAGVPAANILVTASHNHSGAEWKPGSSWANEVTDAIKKAAQQASARMRPVSIGYAEDKISFGINRRKVYNGRAVVRLNPDGPNDPRVKVLRFDDGTSLDPVAVLMHAVCHPCFFTWGDNATLPYPTGYPKLSADFPGEAQRFVERVYDGKTPALFLQGCAGDIRPNLPGLPYRCADEADIQWAGRDLGGAVVRALARSVTREELAKRPPFYRIKVASSRIKLPGKVGEVDAEFMAMKIGPYLLLTMPGEPMVEYGFRLEQAISDRAIPIILGYSNGSVGYIATAAAHEVGGYEPEASPLLPEAEVVLHAELGALADQVIGDVFSTFSKHEEDPTKKYQKK